MRVSLHTDEAIETLALVKGLELPGGGIASKPGGPAYPEVTGYLIPTLFDYGENALALSLADWLLSIQYRNGSFPDMNGTARTFDTAACVEGLERASRESWADKAAYARAAMRAREWIRAQMNPEGWLSTTEGGNLTHLYTMRASWIINSPEGARYWRNANWGRQRVHYVAYALEGLWKMGEGKFVKGHLERSQNAIDEAGLAPFWVDDDWTNGAGVDACATCQMAILYHQAGMDASWLVAGARKALKGAEKDSWTAKWYLDMLMEIR